MGRHSKRSQHNKSSGSLVMIADDAPLSHNSDLSPIEVQQGRFDKLRSGLHPKDIDNLHNGPGNSPVVGAGYEHSPKAHLNEDSTLSQGLTHPATSPKPNSMGSGSVSEKEEDMSPIMKGTVVAASNDEGRKPLSATLPPMARRGSAHTIDLQSQSKKSPLSEEELMAMSLRKKEESKAKLAGMFAAGSRNGSFSGSVSRPFSTSTTSISRQSISSMAPSQRPMASVSGRSSLPPTAPPTQAKRAATQSQSEELPDGWSRRKIIPAGKAKPLELSESREPKEPKVSAKEPLLRQEPSQAHAQQQAKQQAKPSPIAKSAPNKNAMNIPFLQQADAPEPIIVTVPLVAYAFKGLPPRPLPAVTEDIPDVWYAENRQKVLEEQAEVETQRRAALAQAKIDSQKSIGYKINKFFCDASAKLGSMAFVSKMVKQDRNLAKHMERANERFSKYFPKLAETEIVLCSFEVSALHGFASHSGHAILTKNHLCIVCKGGHNSVPNLPHSTLEASPSTEPARPVQSHEPVDGESQASEVERPIKVVIAEAIPLARIISVREGVTVKNHGKVFVLDLPHANIVGDALQFFCRDGLVYQLRNIRHPYLSNDGSLYDGKAVDALHRFFNYFDHSWRAAGGFDTSIEVRDD